jgi:hypothetical protein
MGKRGALPSSPFLPVLIMTMKSNHFVLAGILGVCFLLARGQSETQNVTTTDTVSMENPPLQKRVTVHFRFDHLGQATDYPTSPLAEKYGPVEIALTGILQSCTEDWVVLKLNTGLYWISRDSVLLIAGDR